jgi:UDP-glucose 4-epimerase
MKYLVTGGAGFIGANLVKLLIENGDEVTVVDNYAGGRKEERIQNKAKYIDLDICDFEKLNKFCADGFDGIFHLAALPRVSYSMEQPIETHETNVNGTLNVLVCAKENNIKRVVFSSSAAVYGDQEKFPVEESFLPNPVSPYGLHKQIGEQYATLFSLVYGIETVSLRYFNVYGPYFDPEGAYALVVGKFIDQRKNNQPMTICGDGEYYRDYVHVADIAKANILAMTGDSVGKGEIINIGSGQSYSVNELAKLIGGPIEFIAPRSGDPRKTEADISLAKELLGWVPEISLEEGIGELKREFGV